MELRKSFDEDAVNYDRYRPGYPEALFADVRAYAGLTADSRLLEIGVGTGQATLPFLLAGCKITGIELGENLSAYAAEKFRAYPGFSAVNQDFMAYPLEAESCDLVYSATAFHWLPKEAAYPKIMRGLKPGGCIALFWNHPFPNRMDDPSNVASRRVYDALRPSGREPKEFGPEDCLPMVRELEAQGFAHVTCRLYKRVRRLGTEDYIHLLNTYSDHRALPPQQKDAFETAMRDAIDGVGGGINIYDTIDLYLGRKP